MKFSLDNCNFITHHTLDMKFTDVDEKFCHFLGYIPQDLKGRSVYEFHHPQDSASISMSFKLMFHKGHTETPPYRFMAKHGGYAWVQTQGTMISAPNEDIRSQEVLCVHTCLSTIEEADQILCMSQAEASGPLAQFDSHNMSVM